MRCVRLRQKGGKIQWKSVSQPLFTAPVEPPPPAVPRTRTTRLSATGRGD